MLAGVCDIMSLYAMKDIVKSTLEKMPQGWWGWFIAGVENVS